MKKKFYLLITILWLNLISQNKTLAADSQISYSGFIENYPLELVLALNSTGEAKAIAISHFHEAKIMTGKWQKKELKIFEQKDLFNFPQFNPEQEKIQGYWWEKGKKWKVQLNKKFTIDFETETEWKEKEILPPVVLKDKYFRLLVSKTKDQYEPRVREIKIIEKKTNKISQKINLDCPFNGRENIIIDDYNFDGIEDFSILKESYAGANTTSLYFLYDQKTKKYLESGFKGISLTFDKKKKRIYETNQCCAGTQVMKAEYKVVNNKMILTKEKCQKWDEKKQKLVVKAINECK